MTTIQKKTTEIAQGSSLDQYRILNGALKTFLVENDDSAPFLKKGQYAVVDTSDREPEHDEVFLMDSSYGERRRRLVLVTSSYEQMTRRGPKRCVWWTKSVAGWRRVGTTNGVPTFAGLSDGPYYSDGLKEDIVGKVVGVAFAPLGRLLPRSRGWEDEEKNNAKFKPADYIDALHRAGYQIYAVLKPDGTLDGWVETFPDREVPHDADRLVTKMRERLCNASTAKARLTEELLSRDLYYPRPAAA